MQGNCRDGGSRTVWTLVLGLAALVGGLAYTGTGRLSAQEDGPSAAEIMATQKDRQTADDETAEYGMQLVNADGEVRERAMSYSSIELEGELNKILVRFTAPADIQGTGLLTWEQAEGEDQQWLYMPGERRTRRIAGADKSGSFLGSDLAYEDIRTENLDAHEYTLVGEEEIDGQQCWIIEARPASDAEEANSGYSMRELWVRQDIYTTVYVNYYDKDDELLKFREDTDIQHVDGTIYRAGRSVMENAESGHQTVLVAKSRSINDGLQESAFTQRNLEGK